MTLGEMRVLVKECGLDWHRGFVPLCDGDPTNRYAVLIDAVAAKTREECAKICDEMAACNRKHDFGAMYTNRAYWSAAEAIRSKP